MAINILDRSLVILHVKYFVLSVVVYRHKGKILFKIVFIGIPPTLSIIFKGKIFNYGLISDFLF